MSEAQIEAVLDALFAHLIAEKNDGGWCKYDVRQIKRRLDEAVMQRLRERGLHPAIGELTGGGRVIDLPADEVPAFRALQRAEPDVFGGC